MYMPACMRVNEQFVNQFEFYFIANDSNNNSCNTLKHNRVNLDSIQLTSECVLEMAVAAVWQRLCGSRSISDFDIHEKIAECIFIRISNEYDDLLLLLLLLFWKRYGDNFFYTLSRQSIR